MKDKPKWDVNVVVDHACTLGECPVWDKTQKVICWIDILKGEVYEYSPGTKIQKTIPVHELIGSIALCTNGQFIAALQDGIVLIDRTGGAIKKIIDPEAHLPANRFNEGKCDPSGRFIAGTMSISEEPGAGSVYMLGREMQMEKKITSVTISNGMAWGLDHKTFYYIDTPTREIVAYDYNILNGDISNKRVVIQFATENGYPDGMTIDSKGMLWIAHWDGWQVTRWNPHTGEKLYSIPLPVAKVTSCTFGGENLGDLYITSAAKGLTEEELAHQPLAGSLFVLYNCGFKGMDAFEFYI